MNPTQAVINLLRNYPIAAINARELAIRTRQQFPNGPLEFNHAREYAHVDWQEVFDAN